MITDPKVFLNDLTWKDKTIEGSVFPGKPYSFKAIILNETIRNEYLPELSKFSVNKGLKLLATAMTHQEGLINREGTVNDSVSYKTKNPGNVGNMDNGQKKHYISLYEGIKGQLDKLVEIAEGKNKSYTIGKVLNIKPYYSEEIARNCVKYQKSPYVPGYHFTYSGQLQQFVKIYATGARSGNGYLNTIISYFQQNGIIITAETTLLEIINIK